MRNHLLLSLLLGTTLGLAGCPARSGGGGGGDDDDSAADDDDAAGDDMVLTLSISNQTGYDWNGWGFTVSADAVTTAPAIDALDELFVTGTTSSVTETVSDVEYGAQFCLAFRARDTDEDCYDWEEHGNCFNTGAELTVEIVVDFPMWEQGGCPAW